MNRLEESDRPVVSKKRPNKAGRPAAEGVERRGVRPDEATFIQRVRFPPRQGPASRRESSLAPREATTVAKRRQIDRQAVTKVKLSSPVTLVEQRPTACSCGKA